MTVKVKVTASRKHDGTRTYTLFQRFEDGVAVLTASSNVIDKEGVAKIKKEMGYAAVPQKRTQDSAAAAQRRFERQRALGITPKRRKLSR